MAVWQDGPGLAIESTGLTSDLATASPFVGEVEAEGNFQLWLKF